MKYIKEVKALATDAYLKTSSKRGGANCSDYESVGLIGSVVEDFRDDFIGVCDAAERFWKSVKSDEADAQRKEALLSLRNDAIMAACQAIQVAAMTYRAEQTIINRGEQE